jgi:hypothetical protein
MKPTNLLDAINTLPGLQPDPNQMLEKTLETHVRRIWKDLRAHGYDILAYHTHRSDRSEPGYPDWHFLGHWSMFRELKRQKGRVTPEQKIWLTKLQHLGIDADIWRPSDLYSGRIAQEMVNCAKGTR